MPGLACEFVARDPDGVWPLDPGDPDRPGTPDDLGGPSAPGAAGDADVNHRLSVLSSFFSFLIERDTRAGSGRWRGQMNPVPASGGGMGTHGSPGRDAPRRGRRGELCLRSQRRLPRAIDAALAQRLVGEARSWRDKALLRLLWRTGQRIGDWHELHGCHGLLGLRLADVDDAPTTRPRSVEARAVGRTVAEHVPGMMHGTSAEGAAAAL